MSVQPPTVSVVVCAYTMERWDDLVASIESILAQPAEKQIVLVVDHEPQLLDRASSTWPQLDVVANAYRRGLSGARNTGIEFASGDVIVFLDDDARATEGWLDELVAAYDSPVVVGVGGSARPIWPAGRAPAILPPALHWIVGCSFEGQPNARAEVRNLMGCNMSFRREALQQIGGFNLEMGRVGRLPLGCEETEASIRIGSLDARFRIVYEPRAVVRHRVTRDRVTWRYLVRRSYCEGLSKAALSRMLGAGSALSTEAAYTRKVLPRAVASELASIRTGGFAGASAIVVSLGAATAGYLRGRLARRAGTTAAVTEGVSASPAI